MGTGKQRISTAARLEAKAEGGPVLELEHVLVQAELGLAQVAVLELELVQVQAELELALVAAGLELVQVETELELVRAAAVPELVQVAAELVLAQLAAALRTKSVTAAHRRDLVPLLTGEDLAAAAETTRDPVAAEAAIAWERPAAAEAGIAAEEEAATEAEAEEDAGGKIDERKIKTKPKHDDFIKNFSDRFRDSHLVLSRCCAARGARSQARRCVIAAGTEGVRHTATGCR
jgi:hypothetical protein